MRIDNISGLSNQGPLGGIPQPQKQDLMNAQQQYYTDFCTQKTPQDCANTQQFLGQIDSNLQSLVNNYQITVQEAHIIRHHVTSDSPAEFKDFLNSKF